MGTSEPLDPLFDDDGAQSAPAAGSSSPDRADWLCGPEEGLEAERSRNEGAALPAPKLFRPGADGSADTTPAPTRVTPRALAPSPIAGPASMGAPTQLPRPADTPPAGPAVPTPQAWAAAASSVPRVRRDAPARPAAIETMRADFPMDDVEERARGAVTTPEPDAPEAPAKPEHAIVAPDEFHVAEQQVWWKAALEALRTRRIVQVGAGAVVLLLAILAFTPRGPRSTAIKEIRAHADNFNGRAVSVKGRVGEVFEVGGGHAYYLHQGRDTMVVFTRRGAPRVRSTQRVEGTVSTGYLDGQARVAIFEEPTVN